MDQATAGNQTLGVVSNDVGGGAERYVVVDLQCGAVETQTLAVDDDRAFGAAGGSREINARSVRAVIAPAPVVGPARNWDAALVDASLDVSMLPASLALVTAES